jgi:hypothetical protein
MLKSSSLNNNEYIKYTNNNGVATINTDFKQYYQSKLHIVLIQFS